MVSLFNLSFYLSPWLAGLALFFGLGRKDIRHINKALNVLLAPDSGDAVQDVNDVLRHSLTSLLLHG